MHWSTHQVWYIARFTPSVFLCTLDITRAFDQKFHILSSQNLTWITPIPHRSFHSTIVSFFHVSSTCTDLKLPSAFVCHLRGLTQGQHLCPVPFKPKMSGKVLHTSIPTINEEKALQLNIYNILWNLHHTYMARSLGWQGQSSRTHHRPWPW